MDPTSLKFFIGKYPFRELLDKDGKPSGHFITGPVRLSFANLAKPKVKDSGGTVYSAALLVPKGVDLTVAKKVAAAAAIEKFGPDKARELISSGALIMPIKPQDKLAEGYKGFEAGAFYFDAQRSEKADPPKMFDGQMQPLSLDESYSGMWAIVKLRAFYWEKSGKRGVSFGLTSLQKLADDEKFESNNAADGFGVVEHGGASNGAANVQAPGFNAADYM